MKTRKPRPQTPPAKRLAASSQNRGAGFRTFPLSSHVSLDLKTTRNYLSFSELRHKFTSAHSDKNRRNVRSCTSPDLICFTSTSCVHSKPRTFPHFHAHFNFRPNETPVRTTAFARTFPVRKLHLTSADFRPLNRPQIPSFPRVTHAPMREISAPPSTHVCDPMRISLIFDVTAPWAASWHRHCLKLSYRKCVDTLFRV